MSEKYETIACKISEFIKNNISQTGRKDAVFGLSGGIDSIVVAFLCKNAIGSNRCHALIMPHKGITPNEETVDAVEVAKSLGIKYKVYNIESILNEFQKRSERGNRVAVGNLLARIRASMLYYYANINDSLVVGTDDKSEYLIGYFTKYGDGASDILPIRDLYKTEVQKLGEHLGVPYRIIKKPPGAHLWKEHNAQNEIGIDYKTIDTILMSIFDENLKPNQIYDKFGIDAAIIENVIQMYKNSHHKRNLQPFCDLNYFK
ncbi:MAG: NAD(+) synthetase [Cenarchaeum symbiont of Oopsacas minuta]|nr:NAD(+) synthetase [Cenarchaeum symbiont of Oopsacas minuta]